MAGGNVLDLDGLFAPPLYLRWQGKEHRIAGEVFTMDAVLGIQDIQEQGQRALEMDDPEAAAAAGERFMAELRGRVEEFLAHAKPRIRLGDLPPAALQNLAAAIISHGYGVQDEAPDPPPPNRAARRSRSTTTAKRPAGTSQTRR